jgi:hypothetical protein
LQVFVFVLSLLFFLILLQAMQFSMQSFCGLVVLLLALGGGMALQAPLQIFAGLAVCMLGMALYMQWLMLQQVQTMAYNSSCVKADACKMLEKADACKIVKMH